MLFSLIHYHIRHTSTYLFTPFSIGTKLLFSHKHTTFIIICCSNLLLLSNYQYLLTYILFLYHLSPHIHNFPYYIWIPFVIIYIYFHSLFNLSRGHTCSGVTLLLFCLSPFYPSLCLFTRPYTCLFTYPYILHQFSIVYIQWFLLFFQHLFTSTYFPSRLSYASLQAPIHDH